MLPPTHSATLTYLLSHLKTIARASGDNKMGAANLAIVLRFVKFSVSYSCFNFASPAQICCPAKTLR